MRKLIVLAAIAGSLTSVPANAQERAGHAVAGVVAGAIILGPVGAVAGGLIGYTAGPEMSRGLAGEQPRARSKVRRSARSANDTKRATAPSPPPNPAVTAHAPVVRAPAPAPIAAKAAPSIKATQPLPPVQSLD
jgi:hypothetical protein